MKYKYLFHIQLILRKVEYIQGLNIFYMKNMKKNKVHLTGL